MIKSMTGFGEGELIVGSVRYRVEIRTLNNKFLDIRLKMPSDLSNLELHVHNLIKDTFSRGRVDVLFNRQEMASDPNRRINVDWNLAGQYVEVYRQIRERFDIQQPISLINITGAPGVLQVEQPEEEAEAVRARLEKTIKQIMDSVKEMRSVEGGKLADEMKQRMAGLKERVDAIEKRVPQVIEQYKTRLEQKIRDIAPQQLDEARLTQEVCYFADRSDITEEIVRLNAHFGQFMTFIASDEPVGRKLDFLLQEMNREVNTIGSKSSDTSIAMDVVEMKAELEKIREQVQNVE